MLRMFKNCKMQNKLLIGFGMVIIITIITGIVNIYNIYKITNKYTSVINGPIEGLNITQDASLSYIKASRSCVTSSLLMISGDAETFKFLIDESEQFIDEAIINLDKSIDNVTNDPNISPEERDWSIDDLNKIKSKLDVDYRNLIVQVRDLSDNGQNEKSIDAILNATSLGMEITGLFDNYLESCIEASDIMSVDAKEFSESSRALSIALTLICTVISVAMAVLVAYIIKNSITELAEKVKKISDGDLNIDIRSDYKDEIGDLSNRIADIVGIFSVLVNKINEVNDKLVQGDLDVKIEASDFPGDYKKSVEAINSTASYLTNAIESITACANEYAKGNFDISLKQYPGEQKIWNETFDTLQNYLKDVSREISKLLDSAAIGELGIRIEEERYAGEWQRIAIGLNNLMEAIELPIAEASDILEQVAVGDFSNYVKGDYKGQFNNIKIATNKTISNTSEYISDISRILRKISDADLNIHIEKEYIGEFREIKDALNIIVDNFNNLMTEFNNLAEEVAMGANQITDSSDNLANGASMQSDELVKLDETLDEIRKQILENNSHLENANELSNDTKNDGITNKNEMEEMLLSIKEIEDNSTNISNIIKVIDDIAFQTNILALNAAVESARAGAHGKGFAVVADEVRSLAARSQKAASETTELIEKTISSVNGGTKIANSTANSLNNMVEKINEVAMLIQDVSKASRIQSDAIEKIYSNVNQITSVTHTNASAAEESATYSNNLSDRANNLKESLSLFKLK